MNREGSANHGRVGHVRWLWRWVAPFIAVMFIVPSLVGGMHYVWCLDAGHAQFGSCQHESSTEIGAARGSAQSAATIEAPCCIDQRIDSTPPTQAAFEYHPTVESDGCVRLVPLAFVLPVLPEPDAAGWGSNDRRARIGPESPLYMRDCRYLN